MMRIIRPIVVTALLVVVFGAVYVAAQGQDVKSLAGKWVGAASQKTGSNVPLEVELKPDGSYTSMWGSTMGTRMVTMDKGKLVAEGQLVTGAGTAAAGTGRSELTVSNKNGKQVISGVGVTTTALTISS